MQKLLELNLSRDIWNNKRVNEDPEIKVLLEDGWKIVSVTGIGAGAGERDSVDLAFFALIVLEK